MKKIVTLVFSSLLVMGVFAAPAFAEGWNKKSYRNNYWGHKQWSRSAQAPKASDKPVATAPTPASVPAPAPIPNPTPVPTSGSEVKLNAYITAYTYWDNTPAGTANISHPVIHQKAGGSGTYQDPITMAVGHSIISGKDILDYPKGTKFYIPNLRKYFIVEDTCGDGSAPQSGPCHSGYQGKPWLDIWIDGKNGSRSSTDSCASKVTDVHTVVQNPKATYPVVAGPVYGSACASEFGDAL